MKKYGKTNGKMARSLPATANKPYGFSLCIFASELKWMRKKNRSIRHKLDCVQMLSKQPVLQLLQPEYQRNQYYRFLCVCVCFARFLCTKDAKMLCGKWDKCNNEIVSNRNGIKFIFSALSPTVRTKMRTDFRNGMNNPNETQLMRTICIVEIL